MSSKKDQLLLADWRPFNHQLSGWKESSHYRRGGSEQDESKDMK